MYGSCTEGYERSPEKIFCKLDKATFLIMYKSYVRSLLEYSIQALSRCFRKETLFRTSTEESYEAGSRIL